MSVYLLHFQQPYRHAQHYLGYAEDLAARLQAHRSGNGARLVEVVTQAGIGWELVRVWEDGDRTFERRLKNQKNARRLCPICRPAALARRRERRWARRETHAR